MLRDGLCAAGCGAKVLLKTTPNVYCPPCRKGRRRDNVLRSMARQRRKRGAQLIKGTYIACDGCGVQCQRNGARRRFCDGCGAQIWRVDVKKAINLRIGNLIRAGIASGTKRHRKWEVLVGYTLNELMTHLERQFLPGMTWDNRGEWHIDHIRPLCSFEFETPDCPQFREAWALANLRPLWAEDNIRKSGRRVLLL